jgi:hypothetical protein
LTAYIQSASYSAILSAEFRDGNAVRPTSFSHFPVLRLPVWFESLSPSLLTRACRFGGPTLFIEFHGYSEEAEAFMTPKNLFGYAR